jgi:hypothetical protein
VREWEGEGTSRKDRVGSKKTDDCLEDGAHACDAAPTSAPAAAAAAAYTHICFTHTTLTHLIHIPVTHTALSVAWRIWRYSHSCSTLV